MQTTTSEQAIGQTGAAISIDEITAAGIRIADAVVRTPLEYSARLSGRVGAQVYLKREDLQSVRSYKIRGAYNVMAQLTDDERARGVVAASAGNHAQGVAYACRAMNIRGRIYVPTTTPKQKCDRIRWHGGEFVELIRVGDTFDAAAAAAQNDVISTGAVWIHAFDDPRTIAGQGTIAAEIVEQLGRVPDLMISPVGGGGCITGTTALLRGTDSAVRILGVEPTGAVSLAAALVAGHPVTLDTIDSFVDGAAVKRIGAICAAEMAAAGATVAEHPLYAGDPSPATAILPAGTVPPAGGVHITHVDEGAICSAMLELYQNEGIIAEPAGALTTAALAEIDVAAMDLGPDATIVCLVSGGNNDVSRYGEIIERSLVHRGLKHYFLVNFPQEPGALRRFLDEVLGPDDDVTLFEYVKRNNREIGAALVGIELGAPDGLDPLLDRMDRSRLNCQRLHPGTPEYEFLT
ncbi:threonine ammonia-lyase IlvA [Gordonia sp. TBRC 11910]|uniref:L-threonine dehydratase biosynthetic IlvA n=1 Tax=Gordonia asplenii TaxID=2725283 RepID=A0A848L9D8_9ACTN|nr:threonine ammonia-lyase IlvA [Gordonia asplenii]NMO04198.1 threonine ammonia-lyase IlvA [Gordonia asplenii]